jgi:endonuclease I
MSFRTGRIAPLLAFCVLDFVFGSTTSLAEAPQNYYSTAEGKAGADLRAALHSIIRSHHVIPYSSASFDTSDALKILDQSPTNASYVTLIYNGSNQLASDFALATGWNREHMWAQSYGLDGVEPSYSDLFNLRACDANVNSSRGNKYYDTTATNSAGYSFPAHIEAPRPSDRGDIARALFYMVIRYTGDTANEPALTLTDNPALITTANANIGKLSTLLAWHNADPVDAAEQLRNERIYSLYQTNRNPFVDHPEWVNLTVAPAFTNRPTLNIGLANNGIILSWLATNQSTSLEVSTNLPAGWITVNAPPALTNGQFRLLWTNIVPHASFRLRTP